MKQHNIAYHGGGSLHVPPEIKNNTLGPIILQGDIMFH